MRTLVAAILILAALSGCLTSKEAPPDDTPPLPEAEPAWAVRALYGDADPTDTDHIVDHDHTDAALHRGLSSPNIQILGWDPLITEHHGAPAGGYYCGEVSTGERRIAVVNSFTSNVAIVLVDVTDPNEPLYLGELALPRTQIYDSAITDDGQYVVLATSPLEALVEEEDDGPVPVQDAATASSAVTARPAADAKQTGTAASGAAEAAAADAPPTTIGLAPIFTDACGTAHVGTTRLAQGPLDEAPLDSGVVLVDISDPTEPVVADYVPQPAIGPHSIFSTTIDGMRYVAASTTNLVYQSSYFSFFTVEETPLGGKLVPFAEHSAHYDFQGNPPVQPGSPGSAFNLLNGHVDASIQKHPRTGDVIAYMANWDGGLIIAELQRGQVDVLATWGDYDPARGSGMTGAIHTAHPLTQEIDGRHITLVGQELGGRPADRPTGEVVLLDTSDPAAPVPVARWTLPVDVAGWGGLLYSTHYVAYQDGILWTAAYHAGVWAADADPAHWPELPSIGVLIPDREPPSPAATGAIAPEVLDVFALGGGALLAFDSTTGAYTFTLDRSIPLAPAAPWTQDAWIGK